MKYLKKIPQVYQAESISFTICIWRGPHGKLKLITSKLHEASASQGRAVHSQVDSKCKNCSYQVYVAEKIVTSYHMHVILLRSPCFVSSPSFCPIVPEEWGLSWPMRIESKLKHTMSEGKQFITTWSICHQHTCQLLERGWNVWKEKLKGMIEQRNRLWTLTVLLFSSLSLSTFFFCLSSCRNVWALNL